MASAANGPTEKQRREAAEAGKARTRTILYTVTGVVIVATGAEDVGVRLSLMQAARALLGVDMERIEVIQMRRDAHARTVVFDGLYLCAARGGSGARLVQTAGAAC